MRFHALGRPQRHGQLLTVVCDFDGTIVTEDIGESLCETFAPGALSRADARWHAGEISFREAYRVACLEIGASRADIVAHALARARVRPGFSDLVAICRQLDVEMIVASAGLDVYVEPVLRRHLADARQSIELHVNRARITERGVEVEFPHRHPDCAECGNCKGVRARAARRRGRTVIAVGDSHSDRCLVPEADHVFARGWLAAHCRNGGIRHRQFDDFGAVTELVRQLSAVV